MLHYEVAADTPSDAAVTVAEMRSLMESAEVSPVTRVWREGMDDWTALREVPDVWSAVRGAAGAEEGSTGEAMVRKVFAQVRRARVCSGAHVCVVCSIISCLHTVMF